MRGTGRRTDLDTAISAVLTLTRLAVQIFYGSSLMSRYVAVHTIRVNIAGPVRDIGQRDRELR
jgi:hypothetical protein